ncbi:uncharacterized protein LOC143248793 isoform X2 [Tachypleus tridentatus]|uniref:uncharacterized protein LOC143248793 isoform X2 n=1 Tax=Tachypleus tridentatus TaxID=6853 RepID=UPI003FD4F2DB
MSRQNERGPSRFSHISHRLGIRHSSPTYRDRDVLVSCGETNHITSYRPKVINKRLVHDTS